ncbi:hypothetical protein ZWY2020_051594 [Hordeum vulgare]|nr:hypothetical protein ZWY2020_051594 [Hordeum vulgare]
MNPSSSSPPPTSAARVAPLPVLVDVIAASDAARTPPRAMCPSSSIDVVDAPHSVRHLRLLPSPRRRPRASPRHCLALRNVLQL